MSGAAGHGGGRGRDPRRRDRWIPLAFVVPFVAIIAADGVMAWLAARTDPGLVAGAPVRIGLGQVVPAGTARLDLALETAAGEDRGGGLPAPPLLVVARLRDREGRPLPIEAAEGRLQRAATASADHDLPPFAPGPDGAWRAPVAPPARGDWDVAVAVRGEGGARAVATLRLHAGAAATAR